MPLLKLLDEVLQVGGDYFFRRLQSLLSLSCSFYFFAPRLPGRTGHNHDRGPA
jgi:hypothetical protein